MTATELGWAIFLWVVGLAGMWQLAVWAEGAIRYVCDRVERRVALRQLRELERAAAVVQAQAPMTLPRPIQLVAPPTTQVVITFWNDATVVIDRSREAGKLALLGAILGRIDWHRRPSA